MEKACQPITGRCLRRQETLCFTAETRLLCFMVLIHGTILGLEELMICPVGKMHWEQAALQPYFLLQNKIHKKE